MINKTGTKIIWVDIYSKRTDLKRHVAFTSNLPRNCHRNIPFCLARQISTIIEEENRRLSELQTTLKQQKC